MPFKRGPILFLLPLFVVLLAASDPPAPSGNAGDVRGTVTDPSGAVIPGATVTLVNAVSGLNRSATTDATGQFAFSSVPFNPYRLTIASAGFAPLAQSV